jgi:acyl-CoA synthetase (AMP-forming)/AMP-acid ligase II
LSAAVVVDAGIGFRTVVCPPDAAHRFRVNAGARDVITREVDPKEILDLIPSERVTLTFLVPAVMLFLLQTPGCLEVDFSSLKRIVDGASPIPLDLLREALATFKCEFPHLYGLTETTGVVTWLPPEDHDLVGSPHTRSCGRPVSSAEIKVVAPDDIVLPRTGGRNCCVLPPGHEGLLELAGRNGEYHS